MAIYAIERNRYNSSSGRPYASQFVHELENMAELKELEAKSHTADERRVQRITRAQAMDYVRRGYTHGTRFWLDGNKVRG